MAAAGKSSYLKLAQLAATVVVDDGVLHQQTRHVAHGGFEQRNLAHLDDFALRGRELEEVHHHRDLRRTHSQHLVSI